jgi:hypothetical protein
LLRRERYILPLIFGGVAGALCRPLSAALVYGNALYVKDPGYGFTGDYAAQNLVMYLTALLVLVPGGLVFALFYRGKRWMELVLTVIVYVGLFIDYNYNGAASGGLKQWMLSLRFLIPLTPILAFAMAHTCTRWYRAIAHSLSAQRRLIFQHAAQGVGAVWLTGIMLVGLAVNWRSQAWSQLHAEVVQSLYAHTDPAQPIMADQPASVKFLNELNGPRMLVDLDLGNASNEVRRSQLMRLLERDKTVQIVLFNRGDSDYWLSKSNADQDFIAAISRESHATLKFQQRFPGLGVLRIWNVSDRS